MTMNPVPRKMSQEEQDLIEEYLKNGGKVTVGKYSTGTLTFNYNQKRQKQEDSAEADNGE